ncbi:hypothetical protein JOF53_008512 [Crossiella equi]|uniref:Uncharacterized protein n=1 Tax=Crossiella equi TaxID=130796 RepID=A0ABS5AST6_9PSEU|nr:hypothetical protein [Crossiella equi]MBP2479640.1 hypothetical protein [Crossiella equi]
MSALPSARPGTGVEPRVAATSGRTQVEGQRRAPLGADVPDAVLARGPLQQGAGSRVGALVHHQPYPVADRDVRSAALDVLRCGENLGERGGEQDGCRSVE